ncbi:MAG: isochorismatase family protein, partial [Pseudomonas sp.]
GRMRVEWVAGSPWNRWSDAHGMGGQMTVESALKGMNANSIVLTGVVIHNSMDATIRAGKALGYSIILPSDATTAVPVTGPGGTRWEASTVYELTLAILGAEYAEVMSSDDVIAQLSK